MSWVPDACTLPTAERPVRSAEFDTVFSEALRQITWLSAHHARWIFSADQAQATAIADLLRRESECCSFFTFAISSQAPGTATVDVEVPASQARVLEALTRRASRLAGLAD